MPVTFQSGATTVTLKDYSYPDESVFSRHIAHGFTTGGDLMVNDKGGSSEIRVLTFLGLSTTEIADLRDFFENVIDSMMTSFTFTDNDDDDATQYTVRWLEKDFRRELETFNSHKLTIRLYIEAVL